MEGLQSSQGIQYGGEPSMDAMVTWRPMGGLGVLKLHDFGMPKLKFTFSVGWSFLLHQLERIKAMWRLEYVIALISYANERYESFIKT